MMMALPADKPQPQAQPAAQVVEWYEVYYTPEPANVPTAPELSVLDQMFAYYDA
jgi:hypothetical protein